MVSSRREQKELVRLLVLEHGQKRASELSNVPYETVKKWTQRGKWLASPNVPKSPTSHVADRFAEELETNRKETKLSLSRYAKRAAKDSESCSVKDSPYVHKVAQVASIVWPEEQKTNSILNLAVLIGDKQPRRILDAREVDSEGKGSGD